MVFSVTALDIQYYGILGNDFREIRKIPPPPPRDPPAKIICFTHFRMQKFTVSAVLFQL